VKPPPKKGGLKFPVATKKPKSTTEGIQSQRIRPTAVGKANPRLDADSANLPLKEVTKKSTTTTTTTAKAASPTKGSSAKNDAGSKTVTTEPAAPTVHSHTNNSPQEKVAVHISEAPPQHIEPAKETAPVPVPVPEPEPETAKNTAKDTAKDAAKDAAKTAEPGGSSETVVALYNYTADEEGELTFKEGEMIQVLSKDPSGWWRGRTTAGEEGDFPSNYVGPPGGTAEVKSGEEDGDDEETTVDASFRVLYDYEAEEEGELSIVQDQVLFVFTERGGWFYGKNEAGQTGLFPSNYVERVTS
jgi:hypothetical protein